ncbi:MAG: exodeoxyribonuclease VII large subunit [Planctomycetes bacterium]|nr:exodeoxyribonuclease VII large subunit [Planctomycetota bacterium]
MNLWNEAWDATPPAAGGPRTWKVSELTREIRARLDALGRVQVEGEVVELKTAASGHVYFALRDLDARLSCTIWKSAVAAAIRFDLKEGAQVVAHGKLDVYPPRGTYSLNVSRLEPAGLGTKLAQLEELKRRLAEQGWFERHRPLPDLPRVIGLVTSRSGAALQDFLRTRSARWPLYPLRFAHTSVQGPGAAAEIAAAIERLDASGVDVICVVRGGGSLEDLWAFNELPVLEALRRASVPVVSGVGHETDTTLADLVADVRAHTPTDAAQRTIPERARLVEALERAKGHLARAVDSVLEARERRLERAGRIHALARGALHAAGARAERAANRLGAQAPGARLARLVAQVERAGPRLAAAARAALESRERRLVRAAPRLALAGARALESRAQRTALAARALHAVSPFRVLERGYSITRKATSGAAVRSGAELVPGEAIETLFAAGSALSRVEASLARRPGETQDR